MIIERESWEGVNEEAVIGQTRKLIDNNTNRRFTISDDCVVVEQFQESGGNLTVQFSRAEWADIPSLWITAKITK